MRGRWGRDGGAQRWMPGRGNKEEEEREREKGRKKKLNWGQTGKMKTHNNTNAIPLSSDNYCVNVVFI